MLLDGSTGIEAGFGASGAAGFAVSSPGVSTSAVSADVGV
jgi:hypothetical protein